MVTIMSVGWVAAMDEKLQSELEQSRNYQSINAGNCPLCGAWESFFLEIIKAVYKGVVIDVTKATCQGCHRVWYCDTEKQLARRMM